MMRLRFRQAAKADVQQIVRTGLERHGAAQTERYRARLKDRLELLRLNPHLGRPRHEMGAGVRSLVAGVHVVFYEVDDTAITILRLRHQHEDWLDSTPTP